MPSKSARLYFHPANSKSVHTVSSSGISEPSTVEKMFEGFWEGVEEGSDAVSFWKDNPHLFVGIEVASPTDKFKEGEDGVII